MFEKIKIAAFILVKFNYPVFKLQLDSLGFFGIHSVELIGAKFYFFLVFS